MQHSNLTQSTNRGQAMLIVVLLFLAASLSIVLGVSATTFSGVQNISRARRSLESYVLAESLVEDIVYRFQEGHDVDSNETLSLNGNTALATVTDGAGGSKEIVVEGNVDDFIRRVSTSVVIGEGAAFNFAVQAGNGGFELIGGSQINGNVYANGNITGDGGAKILGAATAANSAALYADQANDAPVPPPNEAIFGNSNGTQDFAQSFQVSESGPLNKVQFYIKRTASLPSNPTVRIVHDNNGVPGTTQVVSQTLSASLITQSFGWVEVVFAGYPQLVPGTTYWVVIDGSNSATKYFTIAANTAYGSGTGKIGKYSGSWNDTTPSGLDGYFRLYMGGITAVITGDGYDYLHLGNDTTEGEAWGHTVNSTHTNGSVYCEEGTQNVNWAYGTQACNTSRPDPDPAPFPISDAQMDGWKAEAETGQLITGNYSVGWAGATLGPAKITGDLSISGGGTLTLTGTIWVLGNVSTSGGGKMKLSPAYGPDSGILITDGRVTLAGDGQFSGSGQEGSYPILITTSVCPSGPTCSGIPALTITGGSGAVVLSSQKGTLRLNGGSAARALTAYKIEVTGGGIVTYDTGLADITFSGGPSGSFHISNWEEVE